MNLSWLLPNVPGIPVLMYHKVVPGVNDALTISPEKLEEQWTWLRNQGYQPLSLADFIATARGKKPSGATKHVLLTFDDGYVNNYTYVYPLLQKMGWQATFFIIAEQLAVQSPELNDTPDTKMSLAELKQLDPAVVQLALHGYHHEHFGRLTLREIIDVMERSMAAFDASGLNYCKALAYPYGDRPKDLAILTSMKQWMHANGIEAAFRIGNQPCRVPAQDMYELRRIDIKGSDSLDEFKVKLRKGKLKPF